MFEKKAAEANIDKEKIASEEKPVNDDDQRLLSSNEAKEENTTEEQASINPTEGQDDATPDNKNNVTKPTGAPKTRSKARGRRRGKRK